jgi:hypothetical protein
MPTLSEIIAALPPTDTEKQILDKDPQAKLPSPPQASKFTGPEPAVAAKLCEEVFSGGKEMIASLIGLIRDPTGSDYTNYKPEYLAHILVMHAGAPGRKERQQLLAGVFASQLENAALPVHTRLFLVRELQLIGTAGEVPQLVKLLATEPFIQPAVSSLVAIREGASEGLREFYPKAQGSARLIVLHGLASLKDAGAAAHFKSALADENRDLRLTAAWGLAQIADASATDAILKVSLAAQGWERIKLNGSCVELADNLVAAGKKTEAAKIYQNLLETRTNPEEKHLRELAAIRLAAK